MEIIINKIFKKVLYPKTQNNITNKSKSELPISKNPNGENRTKNCLGRKGGKTVFFTITYMSIFTRENASHSPLDLSK